MLSEWEWRERGRLWPGGQLPLGIGVGDQEAGRLDLTGGKVRPVTPGEINYEDSDYRNEYQPGKKQYDSELGIGRHRWFRFYHSVLDKSCQVAFNLVVVREEITYLMISIYIIYA